MEMESGICCLTKGRKKIYDGKRQKHILPNHSSFPPSSLPLLAISSKVNKGGASSSGSEPALTPSQIPFCEQFDLTTRISAKALETADTTLIDSGELLRNKLTDKSNTDDSDDDDDDDDDDADSAQRAERQPDQYRNVLDKIRETLIEGGFSTTLVKDPSAAPTSATPAPLAERHICRVGINSIASPSWRSKTPQVQYHEHMGEIITNNNGKLALCYKITGRI